MTYRWLRPAGPPPGMSRWAWLADGILAVALALGGVFEADSDGSGSGTDMVVVGKVPEGSQLVLPYVRGPGVVTGPGGIPVAPAVPAPPGPGVTDVPGWQLIMVLLAGLALTLRRRYPLTTFWLVLAAYELSRVNDGPETTWTLSACLIAGYSAVVYSVYRIPAVVSALLGIALLVGEHHNSVSGIKPGLVVLLFLIPVAFAANAVHSWHQRVRTLEAERDAALTLAVARERARIARELHDVVTHHVSMMVIQAGAARAVLDAAPDRARTALLAVESGGREAIGELRHVMGLLQPTDPIDSETDPPDAVDLEPQPGLAQVPALADRLRGAGVPVEVVVTGPPTDLPAGVDLTAFRVVQEALTNTVKHAAGARVTVHIDYRAGELAVQVADTGGVPTSVLQWGEQRGLIGLRERLALYGGTLENGHDATGGYRVRAVIPVAAESAVSPVAGGSTVIPVAGGSGVSPVAAGSAVSPVGEVR